MNVVLWSLALLLAAQTYFSNSLGFVQNFQIEALGVGARLSTIFYASGLLWAVFVLFYCIRKLRLRLMEIGHVGRTDPVVFLMAVVIMYYAPYFIPVVMNVILDCEYTVIFGAAELSY